ncbi:YqhG family protein [Paenibacillus sp. GCM10012306]|uniref:YqhG family protein n=1 Tax=Paenibacillus sp. GCM10012306 TaxID=3317342 RepID=UPI0036086ED4
MTLSPQQVRKQVMDYLEATDCSIIETSPLHVTVKLSPRADQMLTDRPYYWGFVERTGVEPETLSFTFVFNPEQYDTQAEAPAAPRSSGLGTSGVMRTGISSGSVKPAEIEAATEPGGTITAGSVGSPPPPGNPQDSILSRYFGVMPALPRIGPGLIRREDVIYGSKRLRQIWDAAREEGKCLYLFEDPGNRQRTTLFSAAYEPWLGVCYKVEMSCDLKREELHFMAISLVSGVITYEFANKLAPLKLTPRLPENVHVQPLEMSVTAGAEQLEANLTNRLAGLDYSWAEAARERLRLELDIIDVYYEELLKEPDEEKRKEIEEQYARRRQETVWQYEPQIAVSAVTYGLFHLRKA